MPKKIRRLLAMLLIAGGIFLIYGNSFRASWHFDDGNNILQNRPLHLKEISFRSLKNAALAKPTEPGTIYRPVSYLSFGLNYYLGKDDPFGYHLVNVAIHAVSSIFLFLFLLNLLQLPLLRGTYGNRAFQIALLGTLLWATNPVQTQAVTYIVQRMASMAAMFYIMAMYFYLKARTRQDGRAKYLLYGACAVSSLLAFGSKQNTIVLPWVISLLELWLIQGLPKGWIWKNRLMLIMGVVLPLLASIGIVAYQREWLAKILESKNFTLLERLLSQPRAIFFYMSLLLYPIPSRLSLDHDFAISKSLTDPPTTLAAVVGIVVLVAATIASSRRYPLVSFCMLFFLINHVVESSIIPLELVYEHRNYLPSMLFFAPIAIGLLKLSSYFKAKRVLKAALQGFIVALITSQATGTWIRNMAWLNDGTLWKDASEKAPRLARPHHNLGIFYAEQKMFDRAIREFNLALRLERGQAADTDHLSYHSLGLVYMELKKPRKALAYFLKAKEAAPGFVDPYLMIARIHAQKGSLQMAEKTLRAAARVDGTNFQAHRDLGLILLKEGKPEEAIEELERAAVLNTEDIRTKEYLGVALKDRYKAAGRMEDLERAARIFNLVLREKPDFLTTRMHLAEVYYLEGKGSLFEREILRITKTIPDALFKTLMGRIIKASDYRLVVPDLHLVLPAMGRAYAGRSETEKAAYCFRMYKLLGESADKEAPKR